LATLGCGDFVLDIAVKLAASGAHLCCLGLLENDRFVGDDYFVFESRPITPCGSCRLVANSRAVGLRLDLTRAPAQLHRFIIAVYSDAQRGVSAHGAGTIQIRHGSAVVADGGINANDLSSGPCALLAEIYRRGNGWRLGVLLVGTRGSLESLLRSHGAEVALMTPF
jgi:stress response protein SCP2